MIMTLCIRNKIIIMASLFSHTSIATGDHILHIARFNHKLYPYKIIICCASCDYKIDNRHTHNTWWSSIGSIPIVIN